jgi:hypothetical protein
MNENDSSVLLTSSARYFTWESRCALIVDAGGRAFATDELCRGTIQGGSSARGRRASQRDVGARAVTRGTHGRGIHPAPHKYVKRTQRQVTKGIRKRLVSRKENDES